MSSDDEHDTACSTDSEVSYSMSWNNYFERPSIAVIHAVSSYTGSDSDLLDPLYYDIDLEALDNLFESSEQICISFTWRGYEITVDDETVEIKQECCG